MQKVITLTSLDRRILSDVVEYIGSMDGVELEDFKANFPSSKNWFDECGNLILHKVSKLAQNHIYYKCEFLRQGLYEAENE